MTKCAKVQRAWIHTQDTLQMQLCIMMSDKEKGKREENKERVNQAKEMCCDMGDVN